MDKTELLNSIFDNLVDEIQSEKEALILSVVNNDYKMDRFKNCSRLKTIVAHLFFMAILKNSPSNSSFVNENNSFVEYIRWNAVYVKTIDKHSFSFLDNFQKFESKRIKLHQIKYQAKKLFWNSIENLNASKCLKFNQFFSQSVFYSQMAAELAIKSVLKAKNISHFLWKNEHSIVYLGQYVGSSDKEFAEYCKSLETLGIEHWKNTNLEKSSCLSIRSRYCDYDDNAYLYVKTLPFVIFKTNLAKKAVKLSENIVFYCETLLDEMWKKKNLESKQKG